MLNESRRSEFTSIFKTIMHSIVKTFAYFRMES
jgi:hypothetical protein